MSCAKDFFKLGAMLKQVPAENADHLAIMQMYEAVKQQFIDEVIAFNAQSKESTAAIGSQKPVEITALEYVASLFHALDTLQIDLHEPNHDEMCIQRSLFFNIIKDAVINSMNAKAKPDGKDEGKPPEE